jgi:hypothetical protein
MHQRTTERPRRTRARQTYRTENANPLVRRAPQAQLDVQRERYFLEAHYEHELQHIDRVVPAPAGFVIDSRPQVWAYRNLLLALAVAIIVLSFALLPRPAVTSNWSGQQIIGQSYAVTPTPYNGPAVIVDRAAPVP